MRLLGSITCAALEVSTQHCKTRATDCTKENKQGEERSWSNHGSCPGISSNDENGGQRHSIEAASEHESGSPEPVAESKGARAPRDQGPPAEKRSVESYPSEEEAKANGERYS